MSRNIILLTLLTLSVYRGNAAESGMEEQFEKCCGLGTKWANEGLRCESFTGPVSGVPSVEQGLCLEAVDICCVRAYHEVACEKGKNDAREGLACMEGSGGRGGTAKKRSDYQRDCCEGCKLGILTGSLDQGCTFKSFAFGKPWDPAFLQCCHETSTSTTITPSDYSSITDTDDNNNATDTSTSDGTTASMSSSDEESSLASASSTSSSDSSSLPTPALDDICELLKGLLCSDICIPTPGSYRCDCPKGKVLLEDAKTCRTDDSIDRCESDNPCEHRCTDTGMAVKCECDPGFILAADGHSCEQKSAEINATTTATTTIDDKRDKKKRKCPFGYKYNAVDRVCDDIDECKDNPCLGGYKCENVVGSFVCINQSGSKSVDKNQAIREICPPGYQWSKQLYTCADIDECADLDQSACPNDTHLCVNTQGSFACHELTAAKFCPAGFKFNIIIKTCDDVDECAEGLHGCLSEVEECRNTDGAYECDVQCRKGYQFSRNLGICIDIDECRELNTPCPRKKPICINTPGHYRCAELSIESNRNPSNMDDNEIVDREFAAARKVEHSIAISDMTKIQQDSPTSAIHAACEPGYRWTVDNNCMDIDECADGPGCQDHERCVNLPGGYDCLRLCVTGWYFDRTTKKCQDVNECTLGRHDCAEGTHICRNTNGSYVCDQVPSCTAGFRRTYNGSCIDIDECIEQTHNCSLTSHQYCVNREGTFQCVTRLPDCMNGYRYSLASRRCEDIDECLETLENVGTPCDARLAERCVNSPGSYRCERPAVIINQNRRRPACPSGYRYDSRTRQCEDVDECAEGLDSCGTEVCYNQPGGYSCARAPMPITEPASDESDNLQPTTGPQNCRSGLKYIKNRGCIDIDECNEMEDACSSNEECVNTVGGFTCNCRIGFRRDNLTQACIDINECQLQNDCLPTQRCDNTLGSYNCVRFLPCGTGYTLNAATEICEDDDECILGTHDCSNGYHCRNTLGSYRCDRNSRGQTWTTRTAPVSTTPHPIARTTTVPMIGSRNQEDTSCPSGFEPGPSGQCADIDECQRGTSNPCARSPLSRCVNTLGSYRCVSRVICGAGWTLDPATSRCVDVDECSEGKHECKSGQICENRQGGYICSCPAGHALGPNHDCIDIDECSVYSSNICGASGKCENTVGSFRCLCDKGFKKSTGTTSCEDINECEENPGICQHDCFNVWGSYRCTCQSGYRLNADNRSCSDVDECTEYEDNNLCVGTCENTPGSYSCRCPDGYRLGMDSRSCQDIDECAAGSVCRDPNEICQNTRGSYRCNRINCPSGYHRDPNRTNRCVRSSRYCPSDDEACFRSPSHFSFNFITFVSMLPIPQSGQLELFTMKGTHLPGSNVRFSMALVDARAPPGVTRVTESCFALRRPSSSQAVLVLTRSIPGPQEIQLDLSMEIYHNTQFAGSAVAKLFIYVTQYEF